MSRYEEFLRLRYHREDEASLQKKARQDLLKETAIKALEHVTRQELQPWQRSFINSMAETPASGGGNLRMKPMRPGSMQWGGRLVTERDSQYCPCGHTIAKHCNGSDGCGCKRYYPTEGQ